MAFASQALILRTQALAYGGAAIGRLPDGRAVFTPFCLAGETVRVQVVEEKRGYARAELLEVLESSPQRVAPRCGHFMECGGCHYQQIAYSEQLAAKAAILADQLERIGGITSPLPEPTLPSMAPYNYRNHVQFHLDPHGKLGYRRSNSDQTLAIRECHLPEEGLNTLWPQLDFEAMPEIERVGLRSGAGDDWQIILESAASQPPEFTVEGLPLSAVHLSPGGTVVLAGSEAVTMQIKGRFFQVSAASFFQTNTAMAESMVQHILDTLPKYAAFTPHTTLLDCYCGVGLFSAFLAPHVGRLIGIESAPSACEDFSANLDEFDHVELYQSSADIALPNLPVRPEIVLVDPPRAGLERQALDGLLALAPQVLVYISCDPATLGRDARRLVAGGYRLRQITPVDLFPQTYHIESISFWSK